MNNLTRYSSSRQVLALIVVVAVDYFVYLFALIYWLDQHQQYYYYCHLFIMEGKTMMKLLYQTLCHS